MASSYTTEPPPTASVLLHTTAGPLTISLFANQTPLTCRNFLQHCLDGTYDNNKFHRVAPGFVIQTGDPTGTGEGGQNIYDAGDGEFEQYDAKWARVMGREVGEKIRFGDEIHSRLKFNRRGLVGLAKGEAASGGGYGSQFFITLGDARAELEGRCTMFGRVEGEGIYNVVKVAEGELVEGTERPVYPEKIQRVEILEMPSGEAWDVMRRRERTAKRVVDDPVKKEKPKKKKAGKALLSFGGDEGEVEDVGVAVRPKKAKFNTALIDSTNVQEPEPRSNGVDSMKNRSPPPARRKARSPSLSTAVPQKRKASFSTLSKTPSPTHHRTPSFHDSTTQFPIRNEESPSNSPTPTADTPLRRHSTSKSKSALESEIAALKESMRRPTTTSASTSSYKKSALESLIPSTSTRGRKRPRPGDTLKDDSSALKMLNAFRARLDGGPAESISQDVNGGTARDKGNSKGKQPDRNPLSNGTTHATPPPDTTADDEEEALTCDLHFIANCQSCSNWSSSHPNDPSSNTTTPAHIADDDDNDLAFLHHSLSFVKDRLGKDLEWKKNMRNLKQEDMAELPVVDPKVKEREMKEKEKEKGKGRGRERKERERERRR